jgi:nicotinamidase-related amidase
VDDGWNWREDAIAALLEDHEHGHLLVAGCHTNQGRSTTGSTAWCG